MTNSRTGRPPKPKILKRLAGNLGGRPLDYQEPKPEKAAQKPRGLATHNKPVSRSWDEIAPELDRLGLLTGLDVGALRLLLQHYQFALEAADLVIRDGLTRRDENGVERKHPALQIFRDNSTMYLKWASEFGMTPTARARLRLQPDAQQLTLADILFGEVENE